MFFIFDNLGIKKKEKKKKKEKGKKIHVAFNTYLKAQTKDQVKL